jgi:hypothetical protein
MSFVHYAQDLLRLPQYLGYTPVNFENLVETAYVQAKTHTSSTLSAYLCKPDHQTLRLVDKQVISFCLHKLGGQYWESNPLLSPMLLGNFMPASGN